jgi:hypothetical protein
VPDYSATYLPASQVTFTADGPLTGGDPVEVAPNGRVNRFQAETVSPFIGVAAHDALAGGSIRVIIGHPIHDGIADGTITAGDQLAPSATPGRTVVTVPDIIIPSTGLTQIAAATRSALEAVRSLIGVAISSAADGQPVRWIQVLLRENPRCPSTPRCCCPA